MGAHSPGLEPFLSPPTKNLTSWPPPHLVPIPGTPEEVELEAAQARRWGWRAGAYSESAAQAEWEAVLFLGISSSLNSFQLGFGHLCTDGRPEGGRQGEGKGSSETLLISGLPGTLLPSLI